MYRLDPRARAAYGWGGLVETIALILAGIFLVNLFIAGWLVTLGLMDRHRLQKATQEIDSLERSLAMPSARRDGLSQRRSGTMHRAISVRERSVDAHGFIVRRFPVLPRLVGKTSIGIALASMALWLAVVVPDHAGLSTITSANHGASVSFPRNPPDREAPRGVDDPAPPASSLPSTVVSPAGQTGPPPNTNPAFEGDTVPTSVAAQSRSSTAISLAWAIVPGAIGYKIERWENEPQDPAWLTIATVEEAVTTYRDVGLEADTTYWYRISALTEEGPAPPSDVVSATTSIAPPTATELTGIETGTTIDLSWIDLADETAYRIERSDHGTSRWITIGTTGQNVTAYADAALTPGVTYRYRIVATNEGGDSAPSNIVSVRIDTVKITAPPDDDPTAPGSGDPEGDKPSAGRDRSHDGEESQLTDGGSSTEASPVTDEDP
jgi:hypothetical protein